MEKKLFAILVAGVVLVVGAGALHFIAIGEIQPPPGTTRRGDDRVDQILALPYMSHTPGIENEDLKGVVRYDRDKAQEGYNLYASRTSPEVLLMDMEGNVVHKWTIPQKKEARVEYAALCPNKDLLVIDLFEDVTRIDHDGRVLWRQKVAAHHDITPRSDGSCYVVINDERRLNGWKVWLPGVAHLSASGEVEEEWLAYDQLDDVRTWFNVSPVDSILQESVRGRTLAKRFLVRIYLKLRGWDEEEQDPLHQNTVTILPATAAGDKDERFREGNLLLCYRNVDEITVYDPDKREFVWSWGRGVIERPHYPIMLDNGNILIYDNGPYRRYSRVIELDPITEEIVWEYVGKPKSSFYSETGGSAQRLPNGNTLITETRRGRVFEVTRDGEIVWEWYHPEFDEGHRSLVYRMIRYPKEQVEPYLQ